MAEEPKRDPVRSLSNRFFLAISGKWFRAYSVVGHVGRTSGRGSTAIRSPPIRSETGSSSLSSTAPSRTGSATSWPPADSTLQTKGRDYQLERPEIITPAQALPGYPVPYRRKMRSRNTQDFIWAHRAAAR